jgi:hypothetical protein
VESRAARLDALVHEWKMDLARIWMPMIALAALLLGMLGGMEIQGCRDLATASATVPSPPAATRNSAESK